MRHKFLVLTVKKWLKSVYIYGSHRKIKTGVPLFFGPLCMYRDSRKSRQKNGKKHGTLLWKSQKSRQFI